jgi:hypothetical protein
MFLPVVGLVDPDKLQPGDLIGVNKDSYLILDMLPAEYDSRVKAMEVRRQRAACFVCWFACLVLLYSFRNVLRLCVLLYEFS